MHETNLVWHSRGYLPHFDDNSTPQHITFRLSDSLPIHVLRLIEEQLVEQNDESRREAERRKRLEYYLDQGIGSCALQNPIIADEVQHALLYFDNQRYHLHAWVVMPNHVHAMISPCAGYTVSQVVHSWKSYTANRANAILGKRGSFWQKEYFDRMIRNEAHFRDCINYIELNPVLAKLCNRPEEWHYSSNRSRTAVTTCGPGTGSHEVAGTD